MSLAEFKDLIAEVFDITVTEITDDLTYDTIEGWDSIAHMEMVAKLEEKYNIELDIEEITEMENIGIIKKILGDHGVNL